MYRANLEGAVNQSLVGDLTSLETSGVLLHEGFKALSCGPELGIFPWWHGQQETGQS